MKKAAIAVLAAGFFTTSLAWGVIGGGEITFKVEGAAPVTYSHEFHVIQQKLKCSDCHYKIFQQSRLRKLSMADIEKGLYCGTCHNGQRAFDVKANCNRCHK